MSVHESPRGMPRRSRGVWCSFSNRGPWVRIPSWPIDDVDIESFAAAQQQQQHAARSTQLSAKQPWVWVCIARLRSGAVRGSIPVLGFRSSHSLFVLLGSSLSSWSAPVPVALAQGNMKEARDMLAIARTGGGKGQFCDMLRAHMGRCAREGRGRLAAGTYLHRFCLDKSFSHGF